MVYPSHYNALPNVRRTYAYANAFTNRVSFNSAAKFLIVAVSRLFFVHFTQIEGKKSINWSVMKHFALSRFVKIKLKRNSIFFHREFLYFVVLQSSQFYIYTCNDTQVYYHEPMVVMDP